MRNLIKSFFKWGDKNNIFSYFHPTVSIKIIICKVVIRKKTDIDVDKYRVNNMKKKSSDETFISWKKKSEDLTRFENIYRNFVLQTYWVVSKCFTSEILQ